MELKIVFSNVFLKSIIHFIFDKRFITYSNKKFNSWKKNIINDTRNLFKLNKELNYTAIKGKRNIFKLEKRNQSN